MFSSHLTFSQPSRCFDQIFLLAFHKQSIEYVDIHFYSFPVDPVEYRNSSTDHLFNEIDQEFQIDFIGNSLHSRTCLFVLRETFRRHFLHVQVLRLRLMDRPVNRLVLMQ